MLIQASFLFAISFGHAHGGLLGAGTGEGSCAAAPFRAYTVKWSYGCPSFAPCCSEYGYCRPSEEWDYGTFRDCNGVSNGTPLPAETIAAEAEAGPYHGKPAGKIGPPPEVLKAHHHSPPPAQYPVIPQPEPQPVLHHPHHQVQHPVHPMFPQPEPLPFVNGPHPEPHLTHHPIPQADPLPVLHPHSSPLTQSSLLFQTQHQILPPNHPEPLPLHPFIVKPQLNLPLNPIHPPPQQVQHHHRPPVVNPQRTQIPPLSIITRPRSPTHNLPSFHGDIAPFVNFGSRLIPQQHLGPVIVNPAPIISDVLPISAHSLSNPSLSTLGQYLFQRQIPAFDTSHFGAPAIRIPVATPSPTLMLSPDHYIMQFEPVPHPNHLIDSPFPVISSGNLVQPPIFQPSQIPPITPFQKPSSQCQQPVGGGSYTCISFGSPQRPIYAYHTRFDREGIFFGEGSVFPGKLRGNPVRRTRRRLPKTLIEWASSNTKVVNQKVIKYNSELKKMLPNEKYQTNFEFI